MEASASEPVVAATEAAMRVKRDAFPMTPTPAPKARSISSNELAKEIAGWAAILRSFLRVSSISWSLRSSSVGLPESYSNSNSSGV